MNDNLVRQLRSCTNLPSLPAIAIKVIELANNPNASITEISDYVEMDPALAAKMLKISGSALYNRRQSPSTIKQAVNVLGTNGAIMIALSFSLTNSFRNRAAGAIDSTLFWRRSFLGALACRELGNVKKMKELDELFLAGLMQNIGILAFDTLLPQDYAQAIAAITTHEELLATERSTFGAGHDEVGHWLLKHWNVPDFLAQACLKSHHNQGSATVSTFDACVIVSGYITDMFFAPSDITCASRAAQAAQCELLGIDETTLATVFDAISIKLKAVEDLFEISIFPGSEAATILEQAKELLLACALSRVQELADQAQRDALTGLHNRRYFDTALKREFAIATRQHRPMSVALIDIDHFKAINDTHGHPAGDAVLTQIARAMQSGLRECDILFRYGGDEFAVILPDTSLDLALPILQRLKSNLVNYPLQLEQGLLLTVTISVGFAAHMDGEMQFTTPEELMKKVDLAFYGAKTGGRNHIVQWTTPGE